MPTEARSADTLVLMYHAVGPPTDTAFRRFVVGSDELTGHLEAVRGSGAAIVRVCDLGRSADRPEVVFTFDDAFADFAELAAPVLAAAGAVATVYVPAGRAGQRAAWLPGCDGHRRILGWSDLRDLAAAGHEIGSHGWSHRALDEMPATELLDELVRSKAAIEDATGRPCTSLCYPFGFTSERVRRAARQAGYSHGVAVGYRRWSERADPFAVTRLFVGPGVVGQRVLDLDRTRENVAGRLRTTAAPLWRLARRAAPSRGSRDD